ncbi:MAG: tetratricopeptide repeat protein [Chloroflexi bacterium]|nr:MAG: tetratricopeptide repeat protein [Chloroflexota bacterium]
MWQPVSSTSLNTKSERHGPYEEALALHQRALDRYEQRLGPDHPDTQVARRNDTALLHELSDRASS